MESKFVGTRSLPCASGRRASDARRGRDAKAELLIGLVDRAAADNGAEDARLGELGGRNFGEVVRKDDEVGVLALFQFALLPFFKLRVGGSRGVRANAIRKRDFLLRLPSVFRTAIRTFARHASVQAAKRTDRL